MPNDSDLNANSPFHGVAGRAWMSLLASESDQDLFKEALEFMPFEAALSAMQEWQQAATPKGSGRRAGQRHGSRSASKTEETHTSTGETTSKPFADGSVCKLPAQRNRLVVVHVDPTATERCTQNCIALDMMPAPSHLIHTFAPVWLAGGMWYLTLVPCLACSMG